MLIIGLCANCFTYIESSACNSHNNSMRDIHLLSPPFQMKYKSTKVKLLLQDTLLAGGRGRIQGQLLVTLQPGFN